MLLGDENREMLLVSDDDLPSFLLPKVVAITWAQGQFEPKTAPLPEPEV